MTAPNMELLIDRLLSASTPSDCLDSLEALQNACKSNNNNEDSDGAADAIVENQIVLQSLCHLIGTSKLPNEGEGMEVEGGEVCAAELLLALLPDASKSVSSAKDSKTGVTTEELKKQRMQQRRIESLSKSLLTFHQHPDLDAPTMQEVALIPSLLDCLCAPTSTYARVLTLQILQSLLISSPGVLREQLIQAPDGINRLVDLLGYSPTTNEVEDVPEEVRNAALLFLANLASSSSVLARLITFSEGYSRSLKIALESSTAHAVTIDCLELCVALASGDDVARELFLGGGDGRGNLERLALLIDLRRGERYNSTERNVWWSEELRRKRSGDTVVKSSKGGKVKADESTSRKNKKGKQRKDDLDDILIGADAVSSKTNESKSSSAEHTVPTGPPVPYLTPNETTIIELICNLLIVLLYDGESPDSSRINEQSATKRRARAKEIVSHDLLTRSIVDCALYTLPPPGVDFVSAVPPPGLQQKALMLMAVLGSMGDTIASGGDGESNLKMVEEETKLQTYLLFDTMPIYLQGRVTAMERLMYLACTGAYRPQNEEDENPEATASLIYLNAIAVFRSSLPPETACRMVLHALAPPPPDEGEEAVAPLEMPVVTKLVTTLVENLRFLQSNQHHVQTNGVQDSPDFDITAIYSATIGASGAANALGVLLTKGEGDATREMLFRMTPPPAPPLEPDEVAAGMPEPIASSNLIDFALQFIASYDPSRVLKENDQTVDGIFQKSMAYVTLSLLKLLAEWIDGMPKAVSEILSSPSSVSLGVLVRSKASGAIPAMSGLLLGLCLDYIANKGSSNSLANIENSAWTKETIVNMIQSMGVGKYFGMLDEWKKKAFPLPYCSGDKGPVLERRSISSWYTHSVTQVRRRIVATLAGDSDENEMNSDAEDEDTSTKALRKMVKSQALDMEELQSKLEEAKQQIENQSTQIKSLKRVAELGTQAETNDMLSEFADRVAELEKEKALLIEEAMQKSKIQHEELSAKDQEITSLKDDLRQAHMSIEENERDKENLSEEMAGLSAAYNSLEQEYRSNRYNSAGEEVREMTAGGETAIEGGGLTPVEDSARVNHEIQVLQGENARLREDVRAANEWMAMAVNKMDEMGRENESLNAALQQAQNQTTVLPSFLKEKEEELTQQKATIEQLQGQNEEAQTWIDSAVIRLDALNTEVEELKSRNAEMELVSGDHGTLQSELEEVKAQNITLQGNLSEFQTWSETATNRLAEMEMALQEVTAERDELKNAPKSSSDANSQVEALQAELNSKSDELNDAKAQLEQVQEQLIEESDANESSTNRLKEMEMTLQEVTAERDELKNAPKSSSDDNSQVEALQAELNIKSDELNDAKAQLEQVQEQLIEESDANEAALENLRSQVESLTTARDDLLAQAETSANEATLSQNRLSELELALHEVTTERDELKHSLHSPTTDTGAQIESLQSELKVKSEELADAKAQLERVQEQLIEESDMSEEAIEKLREEVDAEKQRLATLTGEKEELVANLASKQSEISQLNQSITELEAARKSAESHAEELMKLAAQDASRSLEDEIIAITADRNEIKSHFDDLSEEHEETKQTLERIMMENGNLLARNRALEQDNKSLEYQFSEMSSKSTELAPLQSRIFKSEEAVKLWKERADELEANVSALESQLKEQEEEALEAIAQWEARCSSLEGSSEDVVLQWQEKTQTLEYELQSLNDQVAILSEQNCSLQNSLTESSQRMQTEKVEKDEVIASIAQWQERTQSLESEIQSLNNQVSTLSEQNSSLQNSLTESSQQMLVERAEKDEAIASYDEQIDMLTKELIATREESEQVVKQWQTRSEELESDINELNESLGNREADVKELQTRAEELQAEAADVISQWEARCGSLNERIEELEVQLTSQDPIAERLQASLSSANETIAQKENELARVMSELNSMRTADSQKENQISSLLSQLEDTRDTVDRSTAEYELLRQTLNHNENEHKTIVDDLNAKVEKLQGSLNEASNRMARQVEEWTEKEASLNEKLSEVMSNQAKSSQSSARLQGDFDLLKQKYTALEQEKSLLQKIKEEALLETEESNALVYELKEELRSVQEELQSFATDQLSARANEIASHALRESMLEVRSQYESDRKALATEKQLRLEAEETAIKLKSDLALLAQATEYDDSVDIQVRKIAKKMGSENVRKERQEMEELRLALEQLKEELGTCRWKEREAEEKAANARLQKSILEQEVCAAKSDMALMEQAIEDLETSRINDSVALNYRIETLLNERSSLDKSYQEEFAAVKAQLARVNQEKDSLIHRLEQSEKANADLTLNTMSREESVSEVMKLQFERAQLLAKISEIGVDCERRVREAVSAHASSAEAELIIEKQAKQLVLSELEDAKIALEDAKSELATKSSAENPDNDFVVMELRESLAELQISFRELQTANEELKEQMAHSSIKNQSLVDSLEDKLRNAEARARDVERENRFETALASEIARLRTGFPSQNKTILSPEMTSSPEKESISENVLAMHDYVVELLASRDREREIHQAILAERDEALALLAKLGSEEDIMSDCE